MEATPRLALLSFPLKTSPEPAHFAHKLKQYIAEAYHEDPESYVNELHTLEGLRSTAVRPTEDAAGLAALRRYFCQLRALQSRFPMAKGQPAAATFTWNDIFANISTSVSCVKYEMACVLYNIGALHTVLGSRESRTTSEGLKAACNHFQTAAWVFQQIREQYTQTKGVDLSPDVMRFLQELCMAQAQECIMEKSIRDANKPRVIGAVAMYVEIFYRNSLTHLTSPRACTHEIMGTKSAKLYTRYIEFKAAYVGCVVHLHRGMQAEEGQRMGERVAHYQLAAERLAEARKQAKRAEWWGDAEAARDALAFVNDVVEGRRKAAKNENEFIYHEEVPHKDLLTELKPVCLVKEMPINFNDPEISGSDIFGRLVPMAAHEAASVYSEEKAQLLRRVVGEAERRNAELTEFMSSLQLRQLEATDADDGIPQEVVDRCAAMNANTELIQTLVDSMNNLAEIISDVEHSLAEVKELIQEETNEEKEYQKVMGPRPPSIVQTELSREANKYAEAHQRTNDSNQVLHKAMTLHLANLRLLAAPLDRLRAAIPSVTNIEGLDTATMAELKRVVGKVQEMQTQRETLLQQLREAVNSDDITAQLLARTEEQPTDIFRQELEKHTPQVKIIEANLAAQENIINKLTSVYASYGESRKLLTDAMRKRDALINALITSYDAREELLAKCQKGLEFYRKLSTNVGQLLARLRSTCQVQREERATLLSKHTHKSTPAVVKSAESGVAAAAVATAAPDSATPKLKDYLPYMKNRAAATARNTAPVPPEKLPRDNIYPESMYPTSARPAPLGSEANTDIPPMTYQDGYAMQSNDAVAHNMYAQYNYGEAQHPSSYKAYPNTGNTGAPYDYQPTEKNLYPPQGTENNNINYNNYTSNYTPSQYPAQSMNATNPYYAPYYTGSQDINTIVTNSQNPSQYGEENVQASTSINPGQYTYSGQQVQPNQQNYGMQPAQQYPNASEMPSSSVSNFAGPSSVNQQNEFNTNFTQMHISTPPPDVGSVSGYPPDASYSQTYFSAYYQQNNVPNIATYSNAAQPAPTSMSGSQSQIEYSSLNYPYSVASGMAPNPVYSGAVQDPAASVAMTYVTSNPTPHYSQYGSTISDNSMQQSFGAPINPMVGNTTPYSDSVGMQSNISSYSMPDGNTATTNNPYRPDDKIPIGAAMPALNVVDEPIKSHVTGHAISDTSLMQQIYQQNFSTTPDINTYPNNYINTGTIQVDPTHMSSSGYSSTYAEQTPQNISNNYSQSYQSHPGYYYNPSTGNYDYNYGNQSTNVAYNQQNEAGTSQTQQIQENIPHNIYTSAGTHETVQSPSIKTEQPTFPTNESNDQSYYNSPYGYQTAASANTYNIEEKETRTNYGADTNQATYISSGKSENSISTYTSQDRPKPTTTPDATDSTPQLQTQENSPPDSPQPEKASEQSTMDLLSGLDFTVEYKPLKPEIKVPPVSEHVIKKPARRIQPKVEPSDLMDQKVEEETIERPAKRDLFSDPSLLNKFTQEVKNVQKLVDGLTNKTKSGITVLDNKWKTLHDMQAKENMRRSKSAAIDYSGSNVISDVVPFDDSRLTLKTNPEVYINASYYKQLAPWCIPIIISKLPEEREQKVFWTAVLENKVACVVCLLSEMELQGKCYWPTAKGQSLELESDLRVTLEEASTTVHWTERRLTVAHGNTNHTLTHYQINVFPAKVVCGPLVLLVDRVLSATYTNRLSNQLCAAWVHCDAGAGRSALVSLLTMLVCQVRAGQINLCDMLDAGCFNLCRNRTNVLEDTKFLADAYRTALFYVQGVLCSGSTAFSGEAVCGASGAGVPPPPLDAAAAPAASAARAPKFTKESFEEMRQSAGLKSGDMKDPLSFLDPLWTLKKK